MRKLYCYVDETGQDTKGELFIVAIVVCDNPSELQEICSRLEIISGKKKVKWGKAKSSLRLEYMRQIFQDERFFQSLRVAVFHNTQNYEGCTVQAIVRAVRWGEPTEKYNITAYIDGLSKTKAKCYRTGISHQGVYVRKVRGVAKDENEALIRLADAVAGFTRDARENGECAKLYRYGLRQKALAEI